MAAKALPMKNSIHKHNKYRRKRAVLPIYISLVPLHSMKNTICLASKKFIKNIRVIKTIEILSNITTIPLYRCTGHSRHIFGGGKSGLLGTAYRLIYRAEQSDD